MIHRDDILAYVKKKYNTKPEYLWEKNPHYAVLRHQDNKKWYGLIMNVPKEKLGLEGKEEIDIINIKVYPEMIGSLRKEKYVLPAYHMNKEYWISVILSETVSKEEMLSLLDLSFGLTK